MHDLESAIQEFIHLQHDEFDSGIPPLAGPRAATGPHIRSGGAGTRVVLDPLPRRDASWPHDFVCGWVCLAAVVAVFVFALLFRPSIAPVSAAVLLQRSSEAEAKLVATPGRILHRKFDFEERSRNSGRLLSRKRIETWEGGCKRCAARRVYTEQGQLVAGEFMNESGSRTVIDRATATDSRPELHPYMFQSVWALSPSAGSSPASARESSYM